MNLALTLYNIKKWFLMLTGNSILHVYQGLGEEFVPGELRGYHNNLKEKVIMCSELLDNEQLLRCQLKAD